MFWDWSGLASWAADGASRARRVVAASTAGSASDTDAEWRCTLAGWEALASCSHKRPLDKGSLICMLVRTASTQHDLRLHTGHEQHADILDGDQGAEQCGHTCCMDMLQSGVVIAAAHASGEQHGICMP